MDKDLPIRRPHSYCNDEVDEMPIVQDVVQCIATSLHIITTCEQIFMRPIAHPRSNVIGLEGVLDWTGVDLKWLEWISVFLIFGLDWIDWLRTVTETGVKKDLVLLLDRPRVGQTI